MLIYLDYAVRKENKRQKKHTFEINSFAVIFHDIPKDILVLELKPLLYNKIKKKGLEIKIYLMNKCITFISRTKINSFNTGCVPFKHANSFNWTGSNIQ